MDSENFNPVSVARDDRFKALERANKELKKQLSAAKNECERLSKETKAIEVRRDDVKRYKNTVAELKKQEQDRNKRYAELTDAVKFIIFNSHFLVILYTKNLPVNCIANIVQHYFEFYEFNSV